MRLLIVEYSAKPPTPLLRRNSRRFPERQRQEKTMTPESQFQSGAIAPLECLKEGWATIKDRYWLFLGITLVTMLIGGAVPIVLIGPMMCGLYMCLFAKMRGEP